MQQQRAWPVVDRFVCNRIIAYAPGMYIQTTVRMTIIANTHITANKALERNFLRRFALSVLILYFSDSSM